MKPLKSPILHRLEARRAKGREFDLMVWGCVFVVVGGLYALLTWGGVR